MLGEFTQFYFFRLYAQTQECPFPLFGVGYRVALLIVVGLLVHDESGVVIGKGATASMQGGHESSSAALRFSKAGQFSC